MGNINRNILLNDMDKYAKLTFTVRIYLQSLIEDGVLTASLEDGKLVYHRI